VGGDESGQDSTNSRDRLLRFYLDGERIMTCVTRVFTLSLNGLQQRSRIIQSIEETSLRDWMVRGTSEFNSKHRVFRAHCEMGRITLNFHAKTEVEDQWEHVLVGWRRS
jgi:hypothetical protein